MAMSSGSWGRHRVRSKGGQEGVMRRVNESDECKVGVMTDILKIRLDVILSD